ncbi:phage tail tube protein [Pediococcus pentosaceus]|mgnify:CR=1 FL=1|uniref:phage tail tube protein n=1 Tax=Pediococcus pentosaceus TaxID=1255 RepID=UPI001F439FC5|nr:capsid protein [Pediococcus pentosaceus]
MGKTHFELNFKNTLEIDINGGTDLDSDKANASWAKLSRGISTITPAAADTTDATPYWDGEGFTDTEVTGKNITFALSGHRVMGDPAQDYVASHFLDIGDKLRTLARWTDPAGNIVESVATMTSIVPFGGAANVKQTFSFTLALDGKPVYTPASTQPNGATSSAASQSAGTASSASTQPTGVASSASTQSGQ